MTHPIRDQGGEAGWIPWEGGECPVALNPLVEVMFTNGNTSKAPARKWKWRGLQVDFDPASAIVAYRLTPSPDAPVGGMSATDPLTLADQLRGNAAFIESGAYEADDRAWFAKSLRDKADELDVALSSERSRSARLEAALRPFVEAYERDDVIDARPPGDATSSTFAPVAIRRNAITLGHFRQARSALSSTEPRG